MQRLGLTLKPGIKLKLEDDAGIKISLLTNSVYYFIDTVCVVEKTEGYRLFVYHRGETLCNKEYKTAAGAKIAFLRLFGKKAYKGEVKPQWTAFYPPDEDSVLYQLISTNGAAPRNLNPPCTALGLSDVIRPHLKSLFFLHFFLVLVKRSKNDKKRKYSQRCKQL